MNLNYIYAVNDRTCLRIIFNEIDDLCLNGEFSEVDNILKEVDVTKLNISNMVAFLAITLQARNFLKERINYFKRVKSRLEEIDPERIDNLLKGLE